ncbi:hypothetical protein HDEF_1384 [Candidatus Hamiltonella defensa 5AT (Acyrthosiphon pisum)]|uniref:Uncharacterized protein n=1 Tax=Hamiltonella defensa subsp. Acyrthosiphon pisum (strain 5AT) TaxID=572265 RepID=C4K626_HAMD5|nr:hypothetical protein HDEF_1384 [Candidatus Hamiltonella defensa 5AT (Acyrthosiphon pisum)]
MNKTPLPSKVFQRHRISFKIMISNKTLIGISYYIDVFMISGLVIHFINPIALTLSN